MEITVRGIYLFDIGSPGYTEFDVGSEIINVYDQFPEMMENPDIWKYGKIHSHHEMKAYHSDTDVKDLHEQAPSHAFYVSLVVNFDETYDCEIAVLCKEEDRSLTHKDGKGGHSEMIIKGAERLLRVDCEIECFKKIPDPTEHLGERFKQLEAEKVAKSKRAVNFGGRNQLSLTNPNMEWDDFYYQGMEDHHNAMFQNTSINNVDKGKILLLLKNLCYTEPEKANVSTIKQAIDDMEKKALKFTDKEYDEVLEGIKKNIPSAFRETFKMSCGLDFMSDVLTQISDDIDECGHDSTFGDFLSALLQGYAFELVDQF